MLKTAGFELVQHFHHAVKLVM